MDYGAVLSFAKVQAAHFLISTFPSIFMLLILTDETLNIFNGLITLLQNYYNEPMIIIILYLLFGMTITFLIHKTYIKKKSTAFILSILEISIQSLLIIMVLLFYFIVVTDTIQIEQFFWYLLFFLIISYSIFNIACINQYSVNQPRHLKKIEEILLKNTKNLNERTPHFMRPEGLLWSDFRAGLAINREETIEIIRTIKRDKYCTLIGHPASGKSIILRNIGFRLSKENFNIFYVNAEWLDPEISYKEIKKWDLPNTMLLIDDVHRNPSRSIRLIQEVLKLNIKIIFTFRYFDYGSLSIKEKGVIHEILKKKIEIKVTRDVVINLMKKYCIWKGIRIKLNEKDIESLIYKCGNDLWIATYILLMWNPKHNKIKDISKEIIYEQLYEDRIKKWLSMGNAAIDTLIMISALYQYEISCSKFFINKKGLGTYALKLSEFGDVIEQKEYFVLHHSSVAKIYLETFEHYGFIRNFSSFTANLILNYANEDISAKELIFFKMSLNQNPDEREEKILEVISLNLDANDIVAHIEKETDIVKIINFLFTVSKIDSKLANTVIENISLDYFGELINKENFIIERDRIIKDLNKIDKSFAERVIKHWKKRTAIIATRNNELFIEDAIDLIKDYVDSIIVIDNNSADLTRNLAEKSGAIVINEENNKELPEILITGLKQAKKMNSELVIIFPAETTHIIRFMRSKMDNFILPILNDEQDLIIGTYPRLHFIEKRPSTRPPYSRQSRTRRISIHALNTKAIDCYLKFLNRKEFVTHGISISKILFKNYLRISDISTLIPIDYKGFEISSESLKEWSTRA